MKVKMILFLFLLATVSFGQVITLAEARATTVGDTVTVEGIITTPSWSTGVASILLWSICPPRYGRFG